jgi:Zn-finger protein
MTAIALQITEQEVQTACQEAQFEARMAARDFFEKHGDRDACGFAWVNIYGVRSNSRLGKWLASQGFRKDHSGGLCLWNPSGFPTQSISILEAGAEAYAQVLKDRLGLDKVYAGSRQD